MLTYDNEYRETDWRNECDQRELDELTRDARDMEDYMAEATPRDTKGELIRAQWPAIMQDDAGPIGMAWEPIDEHTAGPVIEMCDASPVAIPERKVA